MSRNKQLLTYACSNHVLNTQSLVLRSTSFCDNETWDKSSGFRTHFRLVDIFQWTNLQSPSGACQQVAFSHMYYVCITVHMYYHVQNNAGYSACRQPDVQNQDLTHRPGDVQSFIHDIVCASYCCSEMLWTQHLVLLYVSLMSYWDVFSKSPAAAAAEILFD